VPSNRRFKRHMQLLDDIVYGMIRDRRQHAETRADLLGLLLAAQDEQGAALPDKQIRDEAITLLLAGHETSATALDWTFHLLAQNPEVEAELLNELHTVLNGQPATAADCRTGGNRCRR
jgi:cytochrome P450